MNLVLLLSAVLFGTIHPVALPASYDPDRALAIHAGDYVVVAMMPLGASSHEERVRTLTEAAEEIARQTGKEVVLTDDLLAFLSLKRMSIRGVSDYERQALALRLSRWKDGLYHALRPKESA